MPWSTFLARKFNFPLNGRASLKTSLKQCSPREKDCTTCIAHAAPLLARTKSQSSIYLISYNPRKKKKTQHQPMRIEGPHIFNKLNWSKLKNYIALKNYKVKNSFNFKRFHHPIYWIKAHIQILQHILGESLSPITHIKKGDVGRKIWDSTPKKEKNKFWRLLKKSL